MAFFGFRLISVALFCVCTGYGQAKAQDLNLNGYKLTFQDDFKTLNVSAYGPGTRWIAHTPWRGDFGDDVFANPGPRGPFSVGPQGLAITATKDANGHWQAGLLSSMDMDGPAQAGFAQQYGYFEIRAKLPCGAGVWPAFWLVGTDIAQSTSELDVFEYYGHDNRLLHSTEHLWVKGKDTLHDNWKVFKVPPGSLCSQFNSYGVLMTADEITYYLNGTKYWQTPTLPQYRQPMYLLIDLAIGGGWPDKTLTSPQVMDVQYVRVYKAAGQ